MNNTPHLTPKAAALMILSGLLTLSTLVIAVELLRGNL